MTELASWKMILRNWRIRNGHTTPEWESYVRALNIQDACFTMGFFLTGAALGYYVGLSV